MTDAAMRETPDSAASRRRMRGEWLKRHGKWFIILPPMLYLLVFFLIPFGFALKISFADTAVRVPPFTDILSVDSDWHIHFTLNLGNFRYLFTDEVYGLSYVYSLQDRVFLDAHLPAARLSHGLCHRPNLEEHAKHLCCSSSSCRFGPPSCCGFTRSRASSARRACSIPRCCGWASSIIRCRSCARRFAVYLGIIYSYLPFMVLPLFATLEKLDHSLLEAAADLGSPPWRAFLDVTLPLSMPGIIAGSMLVFIPAIGEFVIPTLLGGPDNLMIGRVLWDEFFGNRDWPVASAVAIAFLVLLVGPIALYQHYSTKQLEA